MDAAYCVAALALFGFAGVGVVTAIRWLLG